MFKKYYKYIFLGLFLLGVIFIVSPTPVGASLVPCGQNGDVCIWSDLRVLINNVVHFLIFTLGAPLVTIVIIVSGIQLVIKRDSGSYESAKKNLQMALLGLVIMLSAWLIVKAVVYGLTAGKDNYDLRSNLSNKI